MTKTFATSSAVIGLALCMNTAISAQNATLAPLQVPTPHYVSIQLEVMVNKPATDVWKRVGRFCRAGADCKITSGKDGELGAVRTLGGGEIMVAKTELSYTYTQPVRVGVPYNLYHATVEARPVTATTAKLLYTLVFDNSMLSDDAARKNDIERRTMMFTGILQTMKMLAEAD